MARLGHGDPELHLGKAVADRLEGRRKARVEHNDLGVGVVEEVDQLLAAIAVVGINRRKAGLEGGEVDLKVLRAIEEIGCDLGVGADPAGQEVGGEGVSPGVKPAPGNHPVALDQGGTARRLPGYGLPDVGDPPVGHGVLPFAFPAALNAIRRLDEGEVNSQGNGSDRQHAVRMARPHPRHGGPRDPEHHAAKRRRMDPDLIGRLLAPPPVRAINGDPARRDPPLDVEEV